jgi:hypothetical protein
MSSTLKVAIVILEPVAGDLSRAYRGLKTALELVQAGDDVTVLFDGSGVETLAAVSASDSPLNPVLTAISASVRGACKFCAKSHKVEAAIRDAGWPLLDDYDGEASTRALLVEGYQVLTF